MCLLWLTLSGSSPAPAHPEHCSVARGRYGIYANNDFLQVSGSRHRLVIIIDSLDEKLEKLGWERWWVSGDFVICSKKALSPVHLTNKDRVWVRTYAHVRFIRS